mgnify:FL=1
MMKKRNFVIKVLRYITIILFLLIVMIVVIKKWHLIHIWIKCLTQSMGRHSTLENWMFPFLFYASFLARIHNNIFFLFFQVLKIDIILLLSALLVLAIKK